MDYEPAEVSPEDYERQVARHFSSLSRHVEDLQIGHQEKIQGVDGAYVIDSTIRYELMGASFLVLIECKLHKNPIKREDVQVLHQKVRSIGAQKGIFVSSSSYQRGAMDFAGTHGIALARFVDRALLFDVRGADLDPRSLVPRGSRGLALLRVEGTNGGWSNTTLTDQPDLVAEMFPGITAR